MELDKKIKTCILQGTVKKMKEKPQTGKKIYKTLLIKDLQRTEFLHKERSLTIQ